MGERRHASSTRWSSAGRYAEQFRFKLIKDIKAKRANPRNKAVVTSVTNEKVGTRSDASRSRVFQQGPRVTSYGRWAKVEFERLRNAATCDNGQGVGVETTDCTAMMEAMIMKEPEARPFYKRWHKKSYRCRVPEGT